MTSPSSFYKEKEKEFDELFFATIKLSYPLQSIEIKSHILSLSLGLLERVVEWTESHAEERPTPEHECHTWCCGRCPFCDSNNGIINAEDLLAFIKEEKKRIEDAK